MDEKRACEILDAEPDKLDGWGEGAISPDGGLYHLGWYLGWNPGDTYATLDGKFNADDLEAIAWWMRNKKPQV